MEVERLRHLGGDVRRRPEEGEARPEHPRQPLLHEGVRLAEEEVLGRVGLGRRVGAEQADEALPPGLKDSIP